MRGGVPKDLIEACDFPDSFIRSGAESPFAAGARTDWSFGRLVALSF